MSLMAPKELCSFCHKPLVDEVDIHDKCRTKAKRSRRDKTYKGERKP